MDDFCVICKKKDGKLSKGMSKGFASLLQCRQDEKVNQKKLFESIMNAERVIQTKDV